MDRNMLVAALATAGVLAVSPAFAHQYASPDAAAVQPDGAKKGILQDAGIVTSTGAIQQGSGYTVTKNGTGDYTLTFPAGVFKKSPQMNCTPFGIDGSAPICIVYNSIWSISNPTTFRIRIYTPSGALQNNGFMWIEMTAP